jgi:regulator of protease activity HflC (stomatin/prohibitin superfamily)
MAYELPSKEKLREIAAKQDAKEKEIKAARARRQSTINHQSNEEEAAAQIIQVGDSQHPNLSASDAEPDQRNYRGYRDRRELRGLGLSASTRWVDVCCLRKTTRPYLTHPRLSKKVHDSSIAA